MINTEQRIETKIAEMQEYLRNPKQLILDKYSLFENLHELMECMRSRAYSQYNKTVSDLFHATFSFFIEPVKITQCLVLKDNNEYCGKLIFNKNNIRVVDDADSKLFDINYSKKDKLDLYKSIWHYQSEWDLVDKDDWRNDIQEFINSRDIRLFDGNDIFGGNESNTSYERQAFYHWSYFNSYINRPDIFNLTYNEKNATLLQRICYLFWQQNFAYKPISYAEYKDMYLEPDGVDANVISNWLEYFASERAIKGYLKLKQQLIKAGYMDENRGWIKSIVELQTLIWGLYKHRYFHKKHMDQFNGLYPFIESEFKKDIKQNFQKSRVMTAAETKHLSGISITPM